MSEQLTNRRHFLGTATATAAGLTATLAGQRAVFAAEHDHHNMSKSELETCIQNCRTCEATCVATLQYCLKSGGVHLDSDHLTALQDCASMCRTSADMMLRGSSLAPDVCGLCSQACTACAESCESMPGDATMAACAAACRACAETCGGMAG